MYLKEMYNPLFGGTKNIIMKKFEYKTIVEELGSFLTDKELSELGSHGWELCAIYDDVYSNDETHFYFKREQ